MRPFAVLLTVTRYSSKDVPAVGRPLRSCGKELIHKELTAIGRVITRETGTCAPEQGDLGESAYMAKNAEGREIPRWFTFPKVTAELKRSYVPRHLQGVSVFFTGLPSPGQLTNASVLRGSIRVNGGPALWGGKNRSLFRGVASTVLVGLCSAAKRPGTWRCRSIR
jgi:hypothetical protein